MTCLLGAKKVHFPPARFSVVKVRTRAPMPELKSGCRRYSVGSID